VSAENSNDGYASRGAGGGGAVRNADTGGTSQLLREVESKLGLAIDTDGDGLSEGGGGGGGGVPPAPLPASAFDSPAKTLPAAGMASASASASAQRGGRLNLSGVAGVQSPMQSLMDLAGICEEEQRKSQLSSPVFQRL
jgi:hypothetical protein